MRILLLLFLLAATPALAVHPSEMLPDPAQEARARQISRQLRCMVCQGEDIDESRAELAGDIRRLVRARIVAGDSDENVIAYLHDRYGDEVLMRPPVKPATLPLWLMPLLALAAGGWFAFGRRNKA